METQPTEPTSKLTPEQQQSYRDRGFFFPVQAFDTEEAAGFRQRFQSYLDHYAERMNALLPRDRRIYLSETHLFLDWVYRIISHPRVLDAVESVLGPNLLVWGTQWFPKMPGDKAYVSWHQDGTYWGLTPPSVTTAWLALSASTRENGCMRVVPQTHQAASMLPQRETYAPDNMLSRGQEIAVEVDEAQAVDLVLRPGEFSLHHIGTVHGSNANTSHEARIGLAIRFITPDVIQKGSRDLAVLVRGKDDHGHFDLVEPPDRDGSPEESSTHSEALRRKASNIMPKPPVL